MRVLLVGEAPGPGRAYTPGGEAFALYPAPEGCAGHRLWVMSGLSRTDYLRRFDRINLLDHYPGKSWSVVEARGAWRGRIMPLLNGRPAVVLLGMRVNAASGLQVSPAGNLTLPSGTRVFNLPHPSGRNQWYNSEVNRAHARTVMQLVASISGDDNEIDPSQHS